MTETTETTGSTGSGFGGWPAEALAFLGELEQDNTRSFWTANVHRYRAAVLEPTRALAARLTAEFGPARVFRPHVDRRFRPAADPYRTDTGLTAARPAGTPYALMLSTRGLAVQVGYQLFDADQLRRYRAAVDGAAGEDLVEVLARLHGAGLTPDGVPALVERPRGCRRDHPRLPLMRLRALHVDRSWPGATGWGRRSPWTGCGRPGGRPARSPTGWTGTSGRGRRRTARGGRRRWPGRTVRRRGCRTHRPDVRRDPPSLPTRRGRPSFPSTRSRAQPIMARRTALPQAVSRT